MKIISLYYLIVGINVERLINPRTIRGSEIMTYSQKYDQRPRKDDRRGNASNGQA